MSDLSPLPAPGGARLRLNRRQKAAIVIHLLVSGGADPGVRDLPADVQRSLVREMAALRFVDHATLAAVVAEFASELDNIGLHFPRDPGRILAALDGRLSLEVIESLTAEFGDDIEAGDAPWQQVAELDGEALLNLIGDETDEVAAILLSKIPPDRAAELVSKMPEERAHGIAAAFARTEDVGPAAVSRIGLALGRATDAQPRTAFPDDPVSRVGDILNRSTGAVRRGILDSLDASDSEFAARVRAAVFSFENIPDRIDPRDLPKVLKGVDNPTLVTALGGMQSEMGEVVDFILGSISKRLAEQIREEISEAGTIGLEAGEEAAGAIVASIRNLEESGEITLVTPGS